MQGIVSSIQVGRPQRYEGDTGHARGNGPWTTAFFKHPVDGPVTVSRLNIRGDAQADRHNHGGLDKAVLAYAAVHYALWREELLLPKLVGGGFGENLTISGIAEDDVCIGDTWSAADVLFQVSQPRQPCWKLARRWRMPELPKRVVVSGRTGWYLRVLQEGTLTPGDPIELVERPQPDWTIPRANNAFYGRHEDERRALAALPELSGAWQRDLLDG